VSVVDDFDQQVIGEDLEGTHVPAGWGDQQWCTIGQHRDSLSLEDSRRLYIPATYHRQGNNLVGAHHWRWWRYDDWLESLVPTGYRDS